MSPAATIAQILAAAREEHSINLGSPFHLESVLSSSKRKLEVSFLVRLSSWLSSICSLFGIAFVGFIIFSLLWDRFPYHKIYTLLFLFKNCNPFSFFTKTSTDIELSHQPFPNSPNMASPITIVNVPSAPPQQLPAFVTQSAPFLGNSREGRKYPNDIRRAHSEAATLLNRLRDAILYKG